MSITKEIKSIYELVAFDYQYEDGCVRIYPHNDYKNNDQFIADFQWGRYVSNAIEGKPADKICDAIVNLHQAMVSFILEEAEKSYENNLSLLGEIKKDAAEHQAIIGKSIHAAKKTIEKCKNEPKP